MKLRESSVQQALLLTAPRLGISLWRNNVGAARDEESGRVIRYGLGNTSARVTAECTSSDLIGMDGDGLFLAVECKSAKWRGTSLTKRELAQQRFIEIVRQRGGRGGFCRSEAELEKLVRFGASCPIIQPLT